MAEPKSTGIADPSSFRESFGYAERDLAKQDWRHKRFWTWTEDGQLFGSWTWQPGLPPMRTGR